MPVYVCTGDIYGIVCMYIGYICILYVCVLYACALPVTILPYIYLLLEKLYCHYFAVYIKFAIYGGENIYVTILTCITKLL